MGNPDILKAGGKGRGRSELIAALKGKKMSRGQAIKAKCYECMLGYADGTMDCMVPHCPLYYYMPYRDKNAARIPIVGKHHIVHGGKLAKGQMELRTHVLEGYNLQPAEAVLAKCYDCMGGYVDGKCDCAINDCPLYPWMQYKDIIYPHEGAAEELDPGSSPPTLTPPSP
jgi:hypothetical protein